MSRETAGRRRVHINLRAAFGKVTQQTAKSWFRHRTGPGKTEYSVRNQQTGSPCASAERRRPWRRQIGRPSPHRWLYLGQNTIRLKRHSQSVQPITPADRDYLAGDRRVDVKMLVRIDVIEPKPRRTICFELCFNFRCNLSAG